MLPHTQINVRCAEPVIIVNPKLKRNVDNIRYLHLGDIQFSVTYNYRNFQFLYQTIYPYKAKCDYSNINNYYSVTDDGEIIPIFILVPCNKCFICRDKLSQMWQFRGIAESNSSNNETYFITLTYNNHFLPCRGVSVTAVQLFMKRLRNNLDKLGISHNLKYFACGEYGSHTQRPHYHLILWHFPDNHFPNLTSVLNFIEKSWSVWNYETQEHVSIGYAYCKKCNSGSLSYVMKYARKSVPAPVGMNPYFTCCSKFIGLQYFLDNYKFLKANPHLLSLSIKDPKSPSGIFTSPFPLYYKTKLMPNFSSIFPKEIIDAFDYCLSLHTRLSTINSIYPHLNYNLSPILNKYYGIITDQPNLLTNNDIDDSLYHRYSSICPYIVDKIYQETQIKLMPYIPLLENYYNKHIQSLNNSNELKTKRIIALDKLPPSNYTLDLLRIENEKLERWRKKDIDREYF